MLLSETYKDRLRALAGLDLNESIIQEANDLYSNSNKRVKFDVNIMKQAIENGMEIGMIFQSNNDKYKMPIWKTRIVQPVAMGYDKKGQLVVRGIHVTGQSEKKAIETGSRSAQATNEWRLFKISNLKSMFLTGRLFTKLSLPGFNPNDSAMSSIISVFNPQKAIENQKKLKKSNKGPSVEPVVEPVQKLATPVTPKPKVVAKPTVNPTQNKEKEKTLKQKIDKLNKFL